MVVHVYSPNTQEAGGKGSRKIAKFPRMATHHFPMSGCAWGKTWREERNLVVVEMGSNGAWHTASLKGRYLSSLSTFLVFKIQHSRKLTLLTKL